MRKYLLALVAALILVSVAYQLNTNGTHAQKQERRLPNLQELQLR